MNTETIFEKVLNQHDEEAWSATLATLLRRIHEVDRNATQVWFAFYPLPLLRALQQADDRERLAQQVLVQGTYELKDLVDSSHTFLYGHRFWPEVKKAVEQHAEQWHSLQSGSSALPPSEVGATSLTDQILAVAANVSKALKKDESLLVGITAVAFMTIQQAG